MVLDTLLHAARVLVWDVKDAYATWIWTLVWFDMKDKPSSQYTAELTRQVLLYLLLQIDFHLSTVFFSSAQHVGYVRSWITYSRPISSSSRLCNRYFAISFWLLTSILAPFRFFAMQSWYGLPWLRNLEYLPIFSSPCKFSILLHVHNTLFPSHVLPESEKSDWLFLIANRFMFVFSRQKCFLQTK